MFKRILVPLDGSQLAEQALPFATMLARRLKAEVVLTSVVTEADHLGDSEEAVEAVEVGKAAAEDYLARQKAALAAGGVKTRTRMAAGKPHIEIASTCDQARADLIVMTTHGRSGIARWTMGSVADKVLRTANVPLILIHPTAHGTPPDDVKRIVATLDGSELGEAVLRPAQELAKRLGCKVRIVRVVPPPSAVFAAEYLSATPGILDAFEKEAQDYVDEVASRLRSKGLDVSAVARVGIPAEIIIKQASQAGDMIVMGTHGRSGVERWYLGSVADAIVRHGNIPVFVQRPWATPEAGETPKESAATPMLAASLAMRTDMYPVATEKTSARPTPKRAERLEARGRQFR